MMDSAAGEQIFDYAFGQLSRPLMLFLDNFHFTAWFNILSFCSVHGFPLLLLPLLPSGGAISHGSLGSIAHNWCL